MKTRHATALLGNSKHHLHIQSPYEQISQIDCIESIKNSNVALLHLKNHLHFNRHVLPSFLPTSVDTENDTDCIAVALSSNKMTKSLELKLAQNCSNDVHLTCYQVKRNESSLCTDSESKLNQRPGHFHFLPLFSVVGSDKNRSVQALVETKKLS